MAAGGCDGGSERIDWVAVPPNSVLAMALRIHNTEKTWENTDVKPTRYTLVASKTAA